MNTNNSISIASSAMLVELSICGWTARKLDKKVSAEIDVAKGTQTQAGNYHKNLLAGTGFLDTITKYASNARAWHISQTLPWSDSGVRLLPVSNFIAYKEQLNKLEENYTALVHKFVDAYPNLVTAAAFQLGNLFDRTEYPDADKILHKFKFSCNFFPVPQAGDFRVDIGEEAKQELANSCQHAYEERLNNAMSEVWQRLHKCLSNVSERLTLNDAGEEKLFRDSLVGNAHELIELLTHLNVTKDPKLEQARTELYEAIGHHDADSLRSSVLAKESVKSKVDSILSKFDF
jgi:hypothetical protein